MARTERESDRRREEKWQNCWCCRDQQRACRMTQASVVELKHTVPAEKESSLRGTERADGKYAGAALAKRKRNRAVCPEYQIMGGRESRWVRAAPWPERGGSERKHEKVKVYSTVKEGRFQRGKGRQARRASPGEVDGSMSASVDAKALQVDLQSLGFTPSLAKPEIGKEVGRRRACS